MGYCHRCWEWEGIRKETSMGVELEGEGWGYLCLGCLKERAKPTPIWLYFVLGGGFLFLGSICFLAGKEVGEKRPQKTCYNNH